MAYPSLAVLCTYRPASSFHCLQDGHLVTWSVIIHHPSLIREEVLNQVQKRSACRSELHHHTGVCCKPFIHRARVVEGNAVQNDNTQSHVRPHQPSLFRWNQSFIQRMQKYDEVFCIVWADSWYMAKDPIIGDGSTHDVGVPLTWHCNSGPLPKDVLPASPHFREAEAGFNHIHEYVACPCSFKLHYSLRKKQIHEENDSSCM